MCTFKGPSLRRPWKVRPNLPESTWQSHRSWRLGRGRTLRGVSTCPCQPPPTPPPARWHLEGKLTFPVSGALSLGPGRGRAVKVGGGSPATFSHRDRLQLRDTTEHGKPGGKAGQNSVFWKSGRSESTVSTERLRKPKLTPGAGRMLWRVPRACQAFAAG